MNTFRFSKWSGAFAGFLSLVAFVPASGFGAVANSAVSATAVVIPSPPPDADIVDDFNDGDDTNYWNGGMGAISNGLTSISRSFEMLGAHSGSGRSLKLAYNFNTTTATWSGYYLNLNNDALVTKNISAYRQLSFWVKGGTGGVEHLKIGLENTSSDAGGRNRATLYVNDYLDGGITNVWRQVVIPLDAFANLDSLANAKTLTFVFEKSYADNEGMSLTEKTVFVDGIRFSAVTLPVLRVDHFGDKLGANALGGNLGDLTTFDGGATASSSIVSTTTADPYPYSLKSNYNVNIPPDPPKRDWSGHVLIFGGGNTEKIINGNLTPPGWIPEPINLSRYQTLRFYAKAVAGGNPVKFKIELLSGSSNSAVYEVAGITTNWAPYSITLASPAGGTIDKTAINQMNIIYEKWRLGGAGGNLSGTVYFDKIEFSENP